MGCVSTKKRNEPIPQTTNPPPPQCVFVFISDEKDLQILRQPQFNEKFRIVFDQPLSQREKINKNPQQEIIRQKQKKSGHQNIEVQKQYRQTLQGEVFYLVEDLPNSLVKGTLNTNLKVPRLQKEISKFTSMLPCQKTHSIFVRCDTAKMYSINALISGSKGTPYAHGLYHFEINCFDNYPNNPPKVSLLTGREKVRFNPNLYQNGYVCLSLLGTWGGSGCEKWSPQNSNIAQILLSIQSLIMSDDIYFNQPGLQTTKGTLQGKLRNTSYSNIVKIAIIRYAMVQMIKRPTKGFEAVIKNHFLIKRDEILDDCNKWLQQANEPFVNCGQNIKIQLSMSTTAQYGQNLKSAISQLKTALSLLSQS